MANGTCSKCDRDIYARGMCESHYRAALKSGEIIRIKVSYSGPCSVDGCGKPQAAGGLCRRHYDLKRRRGSEYAEPLQVPGRICSVDGCDDDASARGLCPLHRLRLSRNGDPGTAFVRQIERQCRWCEGPFSERDARRDYCSTECARIGKGVMAAHYRYGVTIDEYRSLYRSQNGVCAVCRQPERTQRNRLLSVDHDHVSGYIRGLLCSHCNRAVGLLQDDPVVIESAMRYVVESRRLRLVEFSEDERVS